MIQEIVFFFFAKKGFGKIDVTMSSADCIRIGSAVSVAVENGPAHPPSADGGRGEAIRMRRRRLQRPPLPPLPPTPFAIDG